jgi:hypothetical protein
MNRYEEFAFINQNLDLDLELLLDLNEKFTLPNWRIPLSHHDHSYHHL